MRQSIKKLLLVLVMAVCFFALPACGKTATYDTTVPDQVKTYMEQSVDQYVQFFTQASDEQLEEYKTIAEKQKNTVLMNAIKAWQNSENDLGQYQGVVGTTTSVIDEGTYQTVALLQFEKRTCEISLTCEEDYSGSQITLNPTELSILPTYTIGQKLAKAGMNTLMGMGTVFVVLIFISFIISRFKYINKFEQNRQKKAAAAKEQAAPAPKKAAPAPQKTAPAAPVVTKQAPVPAAVTVSPVTAAPAAPEDDLELIAVIAAAISATSGVPADQLVIRSIRRRSPRRWNRA